MSIEEANGHHLGFFDVSETGESTKCTRVVVVEGTAREKKIGRLS